VKRKRSASKLLAAGVLIVDALSTAAVLGLCLLAIRLDYQGTLPCLTALIGAVQASAAVVLSAYFSKSRAENTRGGIVYDAALSASGDGGGAC